MLKRAVHPGEILKDELDEWGVSPASFARQIDVPANRINQILAGERAVTGDGAFRFGHWLGVDPQFRLNLQAQCELAVAERLVGAKIYALRPAASRVRTGSRAGVHDVSRLAMTVLESRMRIVTVAGIAMVPVSITPYGSGNRP